MSKHLFEDDNDDDDFNDGGGSQETFKLHVLCINAWHALLAPECRMFYVYFSTWTKSGFSLGYAFTRTHGGKYFGRNDHHSSAVRNMCGMKGRMTRGSFGTCNDPRLCTLQFKNEPAIFCLKNIGIESSRMRQKIRNYTIYTHAWFNARNTKILFHHDLRALSTPNAALQRYAGACRACHAHTIYTHKFSEDAIKLDKP